MRKSQDTAIEALMVHLIDTPAGTVTVYVPKTAGHEEPFYPQPHERGCRSSRAVLPAVAEMYVRGVATRDAEAVMREFGIESLSSTQLGRGWIQPQTDAFPMN